MNVRNAIISKDNAVIAFDLMNTLPTPNLKVSDVFYKRQLFMIFPPMMRTYNGTKVSKGTPEVGFRIIHYIKHIYKFMKVIMYSDISDKKPK